MKIYAVKVDYCTSDRGIYTKTEIKGYYTDKNKAEKEAKKYKKCLYIYRDGYVEEIEVIE